MRTIKRCFYVYFFVFISIFCFSLGILNDVNESVESQNQHNQLKASSFEWLWTKKKVVSIESDDPSTSSDVVVDILGDVHVVWEDYTDYNGAGTDPDIFYKRLDVSTGILTMTEVISTGCDRDSLNPKIGVDKKGNVHITWMDETNLYGEGTDEDIFYRRWNNKSGTWTAIEVLSTGHDPYDEDPCIAVDGNGNAHIAWTSEVPWGHPRINYRRWINSTDSWTSIEQLTTEDSSSPDIGVQSTGNTYVVWSQGNPSPKYKFWNVSASSWSPVDTVSTRTMGSQPKVCIDRSDNIHVVCSWIWNYTYRFYNETIKSWMPEANFSIPNQSLKYNIAVDNSFNLHIAFDYYYDGTMQAFYIYRDFASDTWSEMQLINTESNYGVYKRGEEPSIGIDSEDNLYYMWTGAANVPGDLTWSILYKKKYYGRVYNSEIITDDDDDDDDDDKKSNLIESMPIPLALIIIGVVIVVPITTILLIRKKLKK